MSSSSNYAASEIASDRNASRDGVDHLMSFDQYFESTREYDVLLVLHRVVPPVLVSFNCVGSASTLAEHCPDSDTVFFIVLMCPLGQKFVACAFTLAAIWRSSVRRHSTILYQTAWIVANCLTLILGGGLDWVTHMTGQPAVSGLADWTCRVWQALFGVVKYAGGWTIVAMLIERYLTIYSPQIATVYCSTCFAKVSTVRQLFCNTRNAVETDFL